MAKAPVYIKIGCNFDKKLIEGLDLLNNSQKNVIFNQFYGSIAAHHYLAARPKFRLPDLQLYELEEYVKLAKEKKIGFNYTLNSILPGDIYTLHDKEIRIRDLVRNLEDIGVEMLTITSPYLAQTVRKYSNLPLELSTIAHFDDPNKLYMYKELGFSKVCMHLYNNRNFDFIDKAGNIARNLGMYLEIMVNEFCGNADIGGNYSPCIYRDECYIIHGYTIDKKEAQSVGIYPMNKCIAGRSKNKEVWLKSKFVLPQFFNTYIDHGISHFKLTGRTGSTEYILKMAKSYTEEKYSGNLLELWKQLETIYSDTLNDAEYSGNFEINCDNINEDFIKFFEKNNTYDISDKINKPNNFYRKYIKENNL